VNRTVSLKQKVTDKVDEVRSRRPFVDHVIRVVQHYGAVKGNLQAGAVTYFAFLSFFPILALAFAVIGWVANVYPKAQKNLIDAINEVLPNLVGPDPGQVQLSSIQDAAGAAAGIGLVAVLYSGLGWLSSLREALTVVFEETKDEVPGFLTGKLRDLMVMVTIGVVLILSVVVSAVVTSLSGKILDWLELGSGLGWLINLLGIAIGLLANMVLFFLFFKLLADPPLPARSMWSGALLGAVLFEVLKQASRFLLQATASSPAFQAFGIALILVVWINYFSRVIIYAAAWAYTSPEAREIRDREEAEEAARIAATRVDLKKAPEAEVSSDKGALVRAFALGGVSALGVVAVLWRKS
jgi:membrane protein